MTKQEMFKTARAKVSCAEFKAGDYVGIEYYWTDEKGTAWYLIRSTEHGPCNVAYPAHHLAEFCL